MMTQQSFDCNEKSLSSNISFRNKDCLDYTPLFPSEFLPGCNPGIVNPIYHDYIIFLTY